MVSIIVECCDEVTYIHAVWSITVRDIRVILGPVLKLYLVSDVIVTS